MRVNVFKVENDKNVDNVNKVENVKNVEIVVNVKNVANVENVFFSIPLVDPHMGKIH